MITINGFLQRDRLHDLICRWMLNQPQPADAVTILELVYFNNAVVARYLSHFCEQLFRELHHCELSREQAFTKGDLKDRIARDLPYPSPRFDSLLRGYASNPGRYYRETPFHGTLYFGAQGKPASYLGSSRVKRIRRLAEKSARRVVDWTFAGLQSMPAAAEADAALAGAEASFLAQLRSGDCSSLPGNLVINDVAGVKVILEASRPDPVLAVLQQLGCRVLEQEQHTGHYQATNLVIEFRPDKARLLAQPLSSQIALVFAGYGISAAQASQRYAEFIASSEPTVNLEIIVSSYAQMLESEIGSCMHEERIIRQRRNPQYLGQLAQNVEFLMEYLFTFPASGRREVGELPLCLWDCYLPDYFDEVLRRLFNVPSVELNDL